MRIASMNVKHAEFGRRIATVVTDYIDGDDALEGREACHISTLVNGQVRHLFYGVVVKMTNGLRGSRTVFEFDSQRPDDVQLQANVLAQIAADPAFYIPQIEEAQDALDARVILAATTRQLEFDAMGFPYLCSMFGDPGRVVNLTTADIDAASFDVTFESIPPRAVVVDLNLEWVRRRAVALSIGDHVQDEIDRIAEHYGETGFYAGNYTFTPGFTDSWPEQGTTIGSSFVVTYSALVKVDGPDANPPSVSGRRPLLVTELSEDVSGLPEDAADFNSGGATTVSMDSTGFSYPLLHIYGVQAKPMREVVRIVIPIACQELKPGNEEPLYVALSAQGLDEDPTVDQWETDTEYGAGERASSNGMVFQNSINHRSDVGLLPDSFVTDTESTHYGEKLWDPVLVTNAPLRDQDTAQAALSGFGRRCIDYAIRRGIKEAAPEIRSGNYSFRTTIDKAWVIDTGTTVRITGRQIKGGIVEGKVAEVEFIWDLQGGFAEAKVQLACAIGSGNSDGDFGNGASAGGGNLPVTAGNIEDPKDPDNLYAEPQDGWPVRPSWWPNIYSWPPLAEEDPLDQYRPYGNPGIAFDSDPYDVVFPEEAPAWWPAYRYEIDLGGATYESVIPLPWPPDRENDLFAYYAPGGDGGGYDDPSDPGVDIPAATEGGDWDIVRYQLPIYAVPQMRDPQQMVRAKVNWLGVEQQWAMEHPGEYVWDPYGTIPGPDGQYPARTTFFSTLQGGQDWLENHQTEITIAIDDGNEEDARPTLVQVPVTYGWRGPKQVHV